MYKLFFPAFFTAVLYFLLGFISQKIAIPPGYSTILWPSAGLALGAVLGWSWRALPGVFIGSALINLYITYLTIGEPNYPLVTLIALGATTQALLGYSLISAFLNTPFDFYKPKNVLLFLFLGGLVSTLVAPTVGSIGLLYFGAIGIIEFSANWFSWWVGDSIGVIAVTPWILAAFPKLAKSELPHIKSFSAILFSITVITAGISLVAFNFDHAKQKREFDKNSNMLAFHFESRLKNSIDSLYGLAGFVQGVDHLTADNFRLYASKVMANDAAILGLSWNKNVPAEELASWNEFLQHTYSDPDLFIYERNAQLNRVPVQERDKHIVVSFIEPLAQNSRALGYDVYSQPTRKEALDVAFNSNQITPTLPIKLVQKEGKQENIGELIFLPIFEKSIGSAEQKRLQGYATAILSVTELSTILRGEDALLPYTGLYLLHHDPKQDKPHVLARFDPQNTPLEEVLSRLSLNDFPMISRQDIAIGESLWELVQVSYEYNIYHPWSTHFVFAGGFLLTGLFGWFLILIASKTSYMEKEVLKRTEALSLLNQSLVEAETENSRAKLAAEAASRAKSEFLANMSHEIRTPLNGVLGALSLLDQALLPQDQRKIVQLSYSSAESLLDIINDILDLSKIEMGDIDFEENEFDLVELIEGVGQTLAIKAHEKGIELHCPLTVPQQTKVIGDSLRIRQILINLISNAIKFTPKGSVSVAVYLKRLKGGGSLVELSIKDTGIGISYADQQNLFTRFKQADSSTTRKYGGTGLGLAITKELVDIMGGNMGMTSEVGHGSTFWVKLRLKEALSLPNEADHPPVAVTSLLLITSSHKTGQYLSELLAGWNIDCLVLDNFSAAIEHYQNKDMPFQIVIEDQKLCNKTNVKLLEIWYFLCKRQSVKRVLLTNSLPAPLNTRMDYDTYSSEIMKPVRKADLLSALTDSLNNEHGESSNMKSSTHKELAQFNHNILLVEDNITNQIVGRGLLEMKGLRVTVANNGEEALRFVKDNHFDLIFMDCQMPVMDGYEATKHIRKLTASLTETSPQVPIIALSANAMKGEDVVCLEAGMDDFMSKPIDQMVLVEKLSHWLNNND